jgi:hypothetical protein
LNSFFVTKFGMIKSENVLFGLIENGIGLWARGEGAHYSLPFG